MTSHSPEKWNIAIVGVTFKKGERSNSNNYRRITLLNSWYKIYAKVLARRAETKAEPISGEEWNEFRRVRATFRCICTVQQLTEKRKEHNLETQALFLDYEKDFSRKSRTKLWEIIMKFYFKNIL